MGIKDKKNMYSYHEICCSLRFKSEWPTRENKLGLQCSNKVEVWILTVEFLTVLSLQAPEQRPYHLV